MNLESICLRFTDLYHNASMHARTLKPCRFTRPCALYRSPNDPGPSSTAVAAASAAPRGVVSRRRARAPVRTLQYLTSTQAAPGTQPDALRMLWPSLIPCAVERSVARVTACEPFRGTSTVLPAVEEVMPLGGFERVKDI